MSRFAKLAVATVAATLFLIALGALVRATDSGLACPDYPGCYRRFQLLPPVDDGKAWIEHTHRFMAAIVIAMLGWLAVEARRSGQPRAVQRATLWGLIPVVLAQAALGALVVVKFLLHWASVSAHLTLALSILGLATWVAVDVLRREGFLGAHDRAQPSASFGLYIAIVAGVVFVQMVLGSMVTGFYAGMIYSDFPKFNGSVVPQFNDGFVFRQSLHVGHRLVAFALVALVIVLLVRSRRPDVPAVVQRCARVATGLILIQILLGAMNIWSALKAWSVVPHMVVGASLWITLLVAALCARAPARAAADVGGARASVSAA